MVHSISNKHVLVTGANSGIGQQVAIEAAKAGSKVTLIARNIERLQASIQLIEDCKAWTEKPQTQFYSLDLSKDFESIRKVFRLAEHKFGPIYMLVNCAGMAVCGSIKDTPIEDFHLMHNLNLMGTVHAVKAVLEGMTEREEGIIVVTSSLAALFGIYGYPAYTCSKFGLRGFAETLRMEVKPYNISVTLALPPDTDTPGFANEEKTKPEETKQISGSAGLIAPSVVAKQIMKDALAGNFYSTVGITGAMLKNVTAGMAPYSSICEVITQVLTMPVLRIVSAFLLDSFDKICKRCKEDRDEQKNS
ncbi:3-ketodihydrosphingosine reductase [Bemisia tabaci]|uniref:3-ketodihydrosphingosine reductase n=1 Tax=Bemisia tabaci TaxID=7038 RepID=UPI003B27E7E6